MIPEIDETALYETIEHLAARWVEPDKVILKRVFPLLARGRPVPVNLIAEETGATVESVEQALVLGRADRDPRDDVIELFGITLEPTRHLIESLGYEAVSASSAREALGTYGRWRPDAVLLDRNMPGMDGLACAREIFGSDSEARIVIISGYDEQGPDGIDAASREIIKAYLTKPIDIAQLSRVLKQIFEA